MTLESIVQQVNSVCAQLELVLIWGVIVQIRLRLAVAKTIPLLVRSIINYDDPCCRIGTMWLLLGFRGDKSNVVTHY